MPTVQTTQMSSGGERPKMPGLAPIKVNLSPVRKKKADKNRVQSVQSGQHSNQPRRGSPAQPSPRVQAALAASARRKAKRRSSANSNAAVVEGKLNLDREPPPAATILSPKVVSVLRSSAKAKAASRQHTAGGKSDWQKDREAKDESKKNERKRVSQQKPTKTVTLTLAALSRKRSEGRSAPALQRWLQKTLSPTVRQQQQQQQQQRQQQDRPKSSHSSSSGSSSSNSNNSNNSNNRRAKHEKEEENGDSKHAEEDSPAPAVGASPRQERKRRKKKKKKKKDKSHHHHRRGPGSEQPDEDSEAKGAESTITSSNTNTTTNNNNNNNKSQSALPSLRHVRGGSSKDRPTSAIHSSLPAISVRAGTAPASFGGGGALPSIYSSTHQSPRGTRKEESKTSRQQRRLPRLKL